MRDIITAVLICAVVFGGFYGYKFYVSSKESSAQKVFSECLNEFENAKGGTGQWHDVEMASDIGYQKNSGSKLAPFFLAIKSEALYEQGKTKEAIESLSAALSKMSEKDDFFGIYKVKLALMKLDSQDPVLSKEGLDLLTTEIEQYGSGKCVALYNLGLYYWTKGEVENAKNYWTKLVDLGQQVDQKDGDKVQARLSQYVTMAKDRLEQLS